MDAPAALLIPIILIMLYVLISFLRRELGNPTSRAHREPSRPRASLQRRGAPAVTGPRQARQREREPEVGFTRNVASYEESLERSSRPEVSTEASPGRRPERGTAPARTRRTPARRSRPALLATPGAVREAFLTMELLKPPVAFRDAEDPDRTGS